MKALSTLETNVQVLIDQYQDLQTLCAELKYENERQREEIMRTHAELIQLQSDYKHLETAHALLAENIDNEQRERVRQRITNMIAQIDRAIAALAQ